jgi:hypothetical protein
MSHYVLVFTSAAALVTNYTTEVYHFFDCPTLYLSLSLSIV